MPVDIQFGPGGDLFYADVWDGTDQADPLRRGQPGAEGRGASPPPRAATRRCPCSSTRRGSSDPDGDALTYAWDTDGDGAYDDSTPPSSVGPTEHGGTYTVGLKVTDSRGATRPPTRGRSPRATRPPPPRSLALTSGCSGRWATDQLQRQRHRPAGRHPARRASSAGRSRSTTARPTATPTSCSPSRAPTAASFAAPDHEYPSYLELTLTATDSGGLTDTQTIRLDPKTVELSLRSAPDRAEAGRERRSTQTTPFECTVIQGSANTLSAATPQTLAGETYDFGSWSDGGPGHARHHRQRGRAPTRPPTTGAERDAQTGVTALRLAGHARSRSA